MADDLRGLSTVRIHRNTLLDKLKENREGHRAVFEVAIDGYHRAVITALEKALEEAKAGNKYRADIWLPEPSDHTADYDRAIAMLTMSLDDELELSAQEFAFYALDDWGWKRDFVATTSNYTQT